LTLLLIILGTATLIYALVLLLFYWGLRFPVAPSSLKEPFISVVVAVRNEEQNLPNLLADLKRQSYPIDKWELIIVDDNSTDNTLAILQKALQDFPNLKIYNVLGQTSPLKYKKAALAVGIHNSLGEIILTTDADCRMGPDWIRTMAAYFTDKVGIVVGFSAMVGPERPVVKWQAFDYLMLMAAAQGATNLGIAWACSGQNWAFRRVLFDRVGGYQSLRDRLAGDDSLFMQLIRRKTRTKVVFASEERAWVSTRALPDFKSFVRQRIRWSSEAQYMHHLNPVFFIVIVTTFLANLAPLLLGFLALWGLKVWLWTAIFLMIKFTVEACLSWRALRIYKRPELTKFFPFWFLTQMPYVVGMGIASFWGNRIGWKSAQ